mgnify:CR=1 FL=1
MAYLHINNLYRDQRVLLFRECYALEKVHGTSAKVRWDGAAVSFFSGGEKHERFVQVFDIDRLSESFRALGHEDRSITVYGEAYGGKCQGMSSTYGKDLAFVAFDVKIVDSWLDVLNAADVVAKLGLEFVPFRRGPTDLAWIDAQRDADSEIAIRRGIGPGKIREGVVLRPVIEATLNNGERLIAKHKRLEFSETATPREVDPLKVVVLAEAEAIAADWVTPMRLTHVLQRVPGPYEMKQTPAVIAAMTEDVMREAAGEVVWGREAKAAVGTRTARLFKQRVTAMPVTGPSPGVEGA